VAALLNVEKSDHFRLTGPGMIDGSGAAYWKTPSPLGRPRLCAIRDSRDVVVSGVRFTNSPTWNLHLYNCQRTMVNNCRFEITERSSGPSTDGIDIDSSQNILVQGCYFSVNDDCVCLKGNRYDGLDQEPKSLPVKNVRVEGCTFARGMGALTLGTEAQGIRHVELKDSTVRGKMPLLRIKFRTDTANQDYRQVRVSNIKLEGTAGTIVSVEPTHGTKVPTPKAPISRASGISIQNVSGTFGFFGTLSGGTTAAISDVTLRNIHVTVAKSAELNTNGVVGFRMRDVVVQQAQASENKP
jgi:alpha-L-rhamnosidase